LNESQRAMVAGKLANMNVGKPSKSNMPIGTISQTSAAELLNVSERSVKRAKKVQDKAVPESWRISHTAAIENQKIKRQICTMIFPKSE
jgi:esterase/lipase superfamily enzyme